jgi:thiol-disulfide isomerase/thioredoxin
MFALLAALISTAPVSSGPTFIENDYPKALAKAKAAKKLLFVDAWAPWCHSCVVMRETVTNQPAFKAFEDDVVFASIDTERATAAAFLEKYPVTVWPTLFFIDPSNETLRFRWAGSVDAAQMKSLLAAAKQTDQKVVDADTLFAKGDSAGAAEKFMAARKSGDDNTRISMSLISALAFAHQSELCAKTANEVGPRFATRPDQLFAATSGLGCALELASGPAKKALLTSLVDQTKALIAVPDGLMADDVSSAYEVLVDERAEAKDQGGAIALGKAWLEFLDVVAAHAKTPAARAAFDAHRVLAAITAKQPEHLIAPLMLSEKEFPLDYNPPARLALLYQEQGKLDEALTAITRALGKCEGPRKLRLFSIQAGVLEKKGDAAGQKKAIASALAYAKTLPAVQQPARQVAALEETLKTLP